MASWWKRTVLEAFHAVLPEGPRGDRLHLLLRFLLRVRRLPRKVDGGVNDFLYFLATGPEIDREPRRRVTCKYLLRDHVREILGEDRCVPLLGVLESREEVLGFEFPGRCVVKPSHLSGPILVRRDEEAVDRERIASWLGMDYYRMKRERNYRGLRPRVLVEPFLEFPDGLEYKIHCLRGEPKEIVVFKDILGSRKVYRYGPGWELLHRGAGELPRPGNLAELLTIAGRLARDFLFIRVDLMTAEGKTYVGELTNLPGGGRLPTRVREASLADARAHFGERGFHLDDFPELEG